MFKISGRSNITTMFSNDSRFFSILDTQTDYTELYIFEVGTENNGDVALNTLFDNIE